MLKTFYLRGPLVLEGFLNSISLNLGPGTGIPLTTFPEGTHIPSGTGPGTNLRKEFPNLSGSLPPANFYLMMTPCSPLRSPVLLDSQVLKGSSWMHPDTSPVPWAVPPRFGRAPSHPKMTRRNHLGLLTPRPPLQTLHLSPRLRILGSPLLLAGQR